MKRIFFSVLSIFLIMSACTEEDPCDDITCLNGAFCEDGKCDCPEGYTSANCGDQVEPRYIYLRKIAVVSWPEIRTNGDPWDSDSDPDLFWELENEQSMVLIESDSVQSNVAVGSAVEKRFSPPETFTNVKEAGYFFTLYDQDPGNFREPMGKIGFRFYTDFNGFPEVMTIEGGNGLEVELSLAYDWNY